MAEVQLMVFIVHSSSEATFNHNHKFIFKLGILDLFCVALTADTQGKLMDHLSSSPLIMGSPFSFVKTKATCKTTKNMCFVYPSHASNFHQDFKLFIRILDKATKIQSCKDKTNMHSIPLSQHKDVTKSCFL